MDVAHQFSESQHGLSKKEWEPVEPVEPVELDAWNFKCVSVGVKHETMKCALNKPLMSSALNTIMQHECQVYLSILILKSITQHECTECTKRSS